MWQPALTRRQLYRLAAVCLVVLVASAGALHATTDPASADVSTEGLSIADTDRTVGGNVSDVALATTITYDHAVPDATRRVVRIKAGPTENDLALIDYRQTRDPTGTTTGSVDLAGGLVSDGPFEASAFAPPLAGNTTQEVVVQAEIELQRANGDAVTHTTTDTATVTVRDDATLSVSLGGDGGLTVTTE